MNMAGDGTLYLVIVDDNPADAFVLMEELKQYSTRVEWLRDGAKALEFGQQYGQRPFDLTPCVVVLDLNLPKYDGIAVLKALRANPATAVLPVIALTGVTRPQEAAVLEELGVSLYCSKPFTLGELERLVQEIIRIGTEPAIKVAVV